MASQDTPQNPPPFYDLVLNDKDVPSDATRLLAILRPQWAKEQIRCKSFADGCVNTMVRFHLAGDEELRDAIVVRVYGGVLTCIRQRNRALAAMQLADGARCFSAILAIFPNGIAYKYAKGRNLSAADIVNPDTIRLIARKLADFHYCDVGGLPLVDVSGNTFTLEKTLSFVEDLRENAKCIPEKLDDIERDQRFQSCNLSLDSLNRDIDMVEQLLNEIGLTTCMVHGDFHVNNIVYDEERAEVTLLDYDLSGFGYMATDLVMMFLQRDLLAMTGVIKPDEYPFNQETRRLWVTSYLDRKSELMGPMEVSDMAVEKTLLEIEIFNIIDALMRICQAMKYITSPEFRLDFTLFLPGLVQKWQMKSELQTLQEKFRSIDQRCKGADV